MPKKIVVLLFIFISFLQSCNSVEPPPPEWTITLTLEDAASIEAWLKLTTSNLQLPATVTLKQSTSGGNNVTQDIILSSVDSVFYIDSLLPNTTYNFLASSIQYPEISSNQLQVTTLDTTSHDINWEVETVGNPGSFAFDVAIINEDEIWAVGKFI